MNKNSMKRLLSLFLCLALIAAMALSMTGCKDDSKEPTEPTTTEAPIENEATVLLLLNIIWVNLLENIRLSLR